MNRIPTARSDLGILECTGAIKVLCLLFWWASSRLTEGQCGAGGAAPRRKVKRVTSAGYGRSAQEMWEVTPARATPR